MNYVVKTVSVIGLALTIIPAFFVLTGKVNDEAYKNLMLIGTVCWFISAPFWIFKEKKNRT